MEHVMREASIRDLDTVVDLGRTTYYETFGDLAPPEIMTQYLDAAFDPKKIRREMLCKQSQFWILELEEQCAGYLKLNWDGAQTDLRESDGLEIERIYLLRAFQGMGFGRILFERARDVAYELGKRYLWLGVWRKNWNALRFYESLGFVTIGTHEFHMGDEHQTDYLMKKELA